METRLCKRCGQIKPLDEFTVKSNSKSGYGYWCKACHAAACQDWRNRNGQLLPRRKFTDEQIAEWKAYVLEHGSIKEAAAYFGIVAGTMQKYVCDELQTYKVRRNAKIIELRRAECTVHEIAEKLGVNSSVVANVCKENGLGGKIREGCLNDEARARGRAKMLERAHKIGEESCMAKAKQFGLEYIGGYTDSDGYITVVGLCGHEFELSCTTLRKTTNDTIDCPICREEQRREIEKQKLDEAEASRIEKMFASYMKRAKAESNRESQRMRNVHVCPVCGKPTDSRSICCSADCTRRMGNHRKDHRIAKDKRIDKGITAKALYRRDNGICWICGGQCNLDDYEERDGHIICGGNYPSVDHIVPVCDGGEDSWENVKLAHRSCNSARYYREKHPSLA